MNHFNQNAFPFQQQFYNGDEIRREGMSIRDYFAAAALTGLVAHHDNWHLKYREVAEDAYALADAMLEESTR